MEEDQETVRGTVSPTTLQVRRRGGRTRALGTRRPMLLPDAPNLRWSLDFVSDALTDGRRFRVLAVVDDDSRECLALVALAFVLGPMGDYGSPSLSGHRVVRERDAVIARRGRPAVVVSDNGTELTSMAILSWCQRTGIDWHDIAPCKPMQNGFVESFMYRRPRGRKCFERDLHRRVRSCIRPVRAASYMTAGPDGVRGSRPHQRDALRRA